jgi:D-alanine transaminase
MSNTVFLNGDYLPAADARISPEDRGFLFADGVYEVTRAINGRLFLWDAHLERLHYGLRELRIPAPQLDLAAMSIKLLEQNGLTDGEATIYLQITRGTAPRNHRLPPPETPPTVYAFAKAVPDMSARFAKGIGVITVDDIRWGRCDIKSIALLANSLAYTQAHENDAAEALFIRHSMLIEGAHTNAFIVRDGVLATPPKGNMLNGVTRNAVIALAREHSIPVHERIIQKRELEDANEVFVTGTTSDVTPVVRIDGHPVATGAPGPVTRRLQAALHTLMKKSTA